MASTCKLVRMQAGMMSTSQSACDNRLTANAYSMGRGVTWWHAAPWHGWCSLRIRCSLTLLLLLSVAHHSFFSLLFFTTSHLPLGFYVTFTGVAFGARCLLALFLFGSSGLVPLDPWLIRGGRAIGLSLHAPTSGLSVTHVTDSLRRQWGSANTLTADYTSQHSQPAHSDMT